MTVSPIEMAAALKRMATNTYTMGEDRMHDLETLTLAIMHGIFNISIPDGLVYEMPSAEERLKYFAQVLENRINGAGKSDSGPQT